MAPAEIWQGGKRINRIQGNNIHTGKINREQIEVRDSAPGCKFIRQDGELMPGLSYLAVGDSITLDGGEIVKSVR